MQSMEEIKQALTCSICQDIVTLPVHSVCCEKAKSMQPGCLSCVREYYQLNKHPKDRPMFLKSWGGCGCDIKLNDKYIKSSNFYQHTLQLDMIRNILGPSKCHHPNCNVSCETSAELRRHITGTSISNDKYGNCMESITKCNYCNTYDKRKIIEGIHYEKFHASIKCDICEIYIERHLCISHYNKHINQLDKFLKKMKGNSILVNNNK